MMDYVDDEPTVASDSTSTALTGDVPALTGEDPALLKLARKIEACDAVEDAEERRRFVAKHANSFGLSVADVLSRLRLRGTLSAEEVNSHNSHNTHESHTRTHARTHERTHARTHAHTHARTDARTHRAVVVPQVHDAVPRVGTHHIAVAHARGDCPRQGSGG